MVRIALGQINTTVGDLEGNVDTMSAWAGRATEAGADLICFPELAVTGYPPEDLVLRRTFVDDNLEALEELARRTAGGCAVLTGFVDRSSSGIHNAAGLLQGGTVVARYHKVKLPNYGVFDEKRYFVPGMAGCSVRMASVDLGISVCEDAWTPGPPFDEYARQRIPVVLNINGSPYHRHKIAERLDICRDRARETGAWIVYVNAVGGQDELVFDGGSMVVSPQGELAHRAAMFEEDLLVVDLQQLEEGHLVGGARRVSLAGGPRGRRRCTGRSSSGWATTSERTASARCWLGLSGGIDSALTATIASDGLGPEAVRALTMPSPYSSAESVEDALEVARRLGIRVDEIRIDEIFKSYLAALEDPFRDTTEGVAEENLQARIRGNLLMAMSNKFGAMVLATGNKSEYAVGYSTLYGDMAGGFAPIKDVPEDPRVRAGPLAERAGRDAAHPTAGHRQAAIGRAPAEPEGHRHAAAVRGAGPHHRGLRGGGPFPRGHRGRRIRSRPRRSSGELDRRGRVQAPAGAPRREDHAEGLRPGPADAHHEPVPAPSALARAPRPRSPSPGSPAWAVRSGSRLPPCRRRRRTGSAGIAAPNPQ